MKYYFVVHYWLSVHIQGFHGTTAKITGGISEQVLEEVKRQVASQLEVVLKEKPHTEVTFWQKLDEPIQQSAR